MKHPFHWLLVVALGGITSQAQADVIDDLPPGQWVEIPNTKLREVCPPDTANYEFSYFCNNVTAAWGGATVDTSRGRLLVWGGGHADYKGNEVYTFDMASLSWERIWGPTPEPQIPSGDTHEEYDDGNPGSRHTYSGLSYSPPPVDALISMGGSLWQTGFYSGATWSYSFQTNSWTRKTNGPSNGNFGDPSVYDPQTKHVFRRHNQRMVEYDPILDTFTDRAASDGGFWQADVAVALDPEARLMVFLGNDRVDLYHLDTDQYEQDITTTGGTAAALFSVPPGITFDAQEKQFIVWGGGRDVYRFDAARRSFELVANDGDDPGPVTTSGGVFGRFRYMPLRNVFVRVNGVDDNVVALRLTADAGSAGGGGAAAGGHGGGGASASGSGGAAATSSGAGGDGGPGPSLDEGCGCQLPGSGAPSGKAVLWLLALAALVRRRRASATPG